ncbi:MAG: tripartite tricarboxylate transporter substrate-binding protein, partial [Natronospirillum sp.]
MTRRKAIDRLNVRSRGLALGLICALFMTFASQTALADYPDKPIRIIVSYPAGGTGDLVARLTAQGLAEKLDVNVVVENRGGASGAIGTTAVMDMEPDGYNLLATATSTMSIVPHLGSANYDPATDFTTIAKIVDSRRVLAVHPSLPVD